MSAVLPIASVENDDALPVACKILGLILDRTNVDGDGKVTEGEVDKYFASSDINDDVATLTSSVICPAAQALVLPGGTVQGCETLPADDAEIKEHDAKKARALPVASSLTPSTVVPMMDGGSCRCVRLAEGDPIIEKVPDFSGMFASSVSNARQAVKNGLALPPTGVVCKSKSQSWRDGRDVYFFLSAGPAALAPTADDDERTALSPSTPPTPESAHREYIKMTIWKLEDGDPLIERVPDYSDEFGSSITVAQQSIKKGYQLPSSGVVCLSSNKSKVANKPVYYFLSSGTGLTRKVHREVFTLPKELRSGQYDSLNLAKDKDIAKLMSQQQETVVCSGLLVKFNERNKRQERVILVSSQAVYNYGKGRYRAPKTRIDFREIAAVTQTSLPDTHEFVLHVPSQHDFRFHDPRNRKSVLHCLTKALEVATGKELRRNYSWTADLAAVCITKTMGKDERGKLSQIQSTLDTRPPEERARGAGGKAATASANKKAAATPETRNGLAGDHEELISV